MLGSSHCQKDSLRCHHDDDVGRVFCHCSEKSYPGLLKIGNCGCFLITRELLRKVLRGTNN